jgi:ribosomal protein L14E/L6E/L27E
MVTFIPALGAFCVSLMGHDKGQTYVVVKIESPGFVSVADGQSRTIKKPKRKSVKHLKSLYARTDETLLGQICEGTAKDNELHRAIKNFEKSKREDG